MIRLSRQSDVMIGEIRAVIHSTGLIGLHRRDESLTLIPSEAVRIARLLLDRFGDRRAEVDGSAGDLWDGEVVDDGTAEAAHGRPRMTLARKARCVKCCPRCAAVTPVNDLDDEHGVLRTPLCSACRRYLGELRAGPGRWWA